MIKQQSLLLALVLFSLAPAHAAPSTDQGGVNEKDLVQSVELDGLVFPIIEQGKLKNYMFVSARLRVAKGLDAWAYRDKTHLIRDAIILAAHKEQLHPPGDIESLDLDRAETICLKAANAAIGEDKALVEMIFTRIVSKKGFME